MQHSDQSATRVRDASASPAHAELVGRSARFRNALDDCRRYAAHDNAPLLLEGERGVGKTLLARYAHDWSPRASRQFAHISLAAIEDTLVSSALFGHIRGAFTDARDARSGYFVTANGGTLFLDEIGKASMKVQSSLLSAIEEQEIWPLGADRAVRVNVRIIAASNLSLAELVAQGKFLPDLRDRLGWFRVNVPPLRERMSDIPDLMRAFVRDRASRCGYSSPPELDDQVIDAMSRASWPGNVRELAGAVERLLVDANGAAVITLAHCRNDLAYLRAHSSSFDDMEFLRATVRDAGSVTRAARLLGVSRSTMNRHLKAGNAHTDQLAKISNARTSERADVSHETMHSE